MNKLFLLKVCRIQEIVIFFSEKGFTKTYIYEKFVKPHFFISKKTYSNYMGINAKKKLKDMYNLDWKVELTNLKPVDYIGLMDELKRSTPFKIPFPEGEYDQMVKEGCRR